MTAPPPLTPPDRDIIVGGSYTFVPVGLDSAEALWADGFFAAPGDTVVVRQHRPGSHAALLCRPDGTPCGSCSVQSLVPVSDAAVANAHAAERQRLRSAQLDERRRADAARHDLVDLYRAEVAVRRTAARGPAERHPAAVRRRYGLAAALGVTRTRTPAERGGPFERGPRLPSDRFARDTMVFFLDDLLAKYQSARSPFDGLLEAPPAVHELFERHADRIRAPAAEFRHHLRIVLLDALAGRYGVTADRTATGAEVRRQTTVDED